MLRLLCRVLLLMSDCVGLLPFGAVAEEGVINYSCMLQTFKTHNMHLMRKHVSVKPVKSYS